MSVTLQVDGRILSVEEIEAIVRQHFSEKKEIPKDGKKTVRRPKEGKWFEVKPGEINQDLFRKKRNDMSQEKTRQLILEAFAEVEKNPEKYGKPFETMVPKKTWAFRTFDELKGYAKSLGDYNADWVEQALEWAQRIQNGETWKAVCNKPDTANWFRLVVWKNGYVGFVGGSRKNSSYAPASDVSVRYYFPDDEAGNIVPLVMRYK